MLHASKGAGSFIEGQRYTTNTKEDEKKITKRKSGVKKVYY